jgi:hypothetical protein
MQKPKTLVTPRGYHAGVIDLRAADDSRILNQKHRFGREARLRRVNASQRADPGQ